MPWPLAPSTHKGGRHPSNTRCNTIFAYKTSVVENVRPGWSSMRYMIQCDLGQSDGIGENGLTHIQHQCKRCRRMPGVDASQCGLGIVVEILIFPSAHAIRLRWLRNTMANLNRVFLHSAIAIGSHRIAFAYTLCPTGVSFCQMCQICFACNKRC